ncbi:unnamed protein product (macronuclear) [Paramecium tetraurelia]|uniref:Transmembrane protein n=1 Tax=Paramecium tetraurelia TaxID=5888 RepID=A0C6H9_PARTE|nr:uncharacterized protein GSPATT00035525001 [Paramecium tetraurelia]CAK66396.1 unnamed protein product [Paramecium tetraurelia]|eukprot:XP_001433793.1 hypothetical protein (macronuclear) [Paramecium tetraurelia strain d4-2]
MPIHQEVNKEISMNEVNLQNPLRDKAKLQKAIYKIGISMKRKYLQNRDQIEQINREITLYQKIISSLLKKKENQISNMDYSQNKQSYSNKNSTIFYQKQYTDECQKEQQRQLQKLLIQQDNNLRNKREEIEKLQIKLNSFVSSLLISQIIS